MNQVRAFFQLVRWQNLVFIVLTQVLFYFCIYFPLYQIHQSKKLILLVLASVFIAAAGYIINDYFDLNIDRVNKPEKNVIDRAISRRWAIAWHFILSFAGVMLTILAVGIRHWYLFFANIAVVFLLWFYSTSLKRKLLIGNVVISLLTAWTLLIFFFAFSIPEQAFDSTDPVSVKFFRLSFLYGGFAFIISLIREAIKDVEDMKGDDRYGCKTLPIVAGVRTTKIYTAVWISVLIATLVILQFYVLQFGWWPSVVYALLLVIYPLFSVLLKLRNATLPAEFGHLSSATKRIMLSGILSMIFFLFIFKRMAKLILASQSPRRKQLLEWAEVDFEILVEETAETYPEGLTPEEVAVHIARQKAAAVRSHTEKPILAADTIVVLDSAIIGKPKTRDEAVAILQKLSGRHHQVVTGVVISVGGNEIAFSDITDVAFHPLTVEQLQFYVDKYKPYDKAGAYAIQEWIGVVGIKFIRGDFYNVMGLPVSRVVQALRSLSIVE